LERVPYQVTPAALRYAGIEALPVSVLLENIRSVYNVGAFFRTADATSADLLLLCGITAAPPHRGIAKTALGAEETVRWERQEDSLDAVRRLRERGCEIAAVETSPHAVDLFEWVPRFPVCVVFGNELDGVTRAVSEACDRHVRIPMLGLKHSLNVATAGGVVLYELLRKYRELGR
jgi:tRNA G18 (ribose-2'-O)-methylase SpoU